MRERPDVIWKYTLALSVIGLFIPLQVIFERHLTHGVTFRALFENFTTVEWLVFTLSLTQAVLAHYASPYILAATPSFLVSFGWYGWVAGAHVFAGEPRAIIAFLIAAAGIGVQVPFFRRPEIRKLVMNPGLRWWRVPERSRKQFKVFIRPVLGGEFESTTVDLSISGAFIHHDRIKWNALQEVNPEYISTGMRCSVKFIFSHLHSLQCNAEIVRCAKAKGGYPEGFAVRFVSIDPQQRKLLLSYLNSTDPFKSSIASVEAHC